MQFVADIVFLPPLLMKCYCVTSFSDVLQLIEGTARSHHHNDDILLEYINEPLQDDRG